MSKKIRAFYFSASDRKLRYGDNRKIVIGKTHKVKGPVRLCQNGLHASKKLVDALQYAPGTILYLVELSGEIREGRDKLVATERTYIDSFDAEKLLRRFAKKQALINIKKIKNYCSPKDYNLIITYLNGGDEKRRADVRDAAWSAARYAINADGAAARAAAWSATEAAVTAAAWAAGAAAELGKWVKVRAASHKMLVEMVKKETGWDI